MKEQILAVQRMQDYIEKDKTEEISLSDLAGVSLFSPWYSYRLFREALGLTPTEYIRKYRLTQAAKQLRSGNVKVIDAAFDAGFVRKPECLCIIKRGKQAEDYFAYCEEVSSDVWGMLMSMQSLCGEPVSMWLPEKYKQPNTSTDLCWQARKAGINYKCMNKLL